MFSEPSETHQIHVEAEHDVDENVMEMDEDEDGECINTSSGIYKLYLLTSLYLIDVNSHRFIFT